MQHTISIYDAGPAVFDYSKLDQDGKRDCLVIKDKHVSICRKVAQEFSNPNRSVEIQLIFPADNPFIPTEEEQAKPSLLSSRIAHSCETDIWKSNIILADVSPWPKALKENEISPMADEGTVYEAGFASGIADTLNKIATLEEEHPELSAALQQIQSHLGTPKIVVPYNSCALTIKEKMASYYDHELYVGEHGMTFSSQDHTMIEDFGDTNNAMLSHAARKQGVEIQTNFEQALRTAIQLFFEQQPY